jgi:hypothetical protein
VGVAGRDDDDVARLGDDRLEAELELHAALDDLEALLLLAVHVQAGDMTVRGQLEVEGEQVAARVGRGLPEGEGLAADGVRDRLSAVGHP